MFTQNYYPLNGDELASAGIVVIPIITLFILLFLTKAIYAAVVAVAAVIIVACMDGALYGAWPICLIVLAAIFLYDICVVTGHFEAVKYTMAALSRDKRCLALLLAYGFSGFIEGASGFSTPVALATSMMVGLGFSKREAATAALLGNTVPVAFGAIGIPTTTLASLVKIDQQILAQAITRLLLPISFIQPFLIVYAVSDWRGVLGAWPVCLFTCIVQTGMALVMAEFVGSQVVSIISMLVTLGSLGVFLHFWQPKEILMTEAMAKEEVGLNASVAAAKAALESSSSGPSAADGSGVPSAPAATTSAANADADEPKASPTASDEGGADAADSNLAGATASGAEAHRSRRGSRHRIVGARAATDGTMDVRGRLNSGDDAEAGAAGGEPRISSARSTDAGAAVGVHKPGVILIRRVVHHAEGPKHLDSSSIATALFPHTRDHRKDDYLRRHPDAQPSASARGSRAASTARGSTTTDDLHGAQSLHGSTGSASKVAQAVGPGAVAIEMAQLPAKDSIGADAGTVSQVAVNSASGEAEVQRTGLKAWYGKLTSALGIGSAGHGAAMADGAHDGKAEKQVDDGHGGTIESEVHIHYDALHPPTRSELVLAWLPWLIVCVLVSIWGSPQVKGANQTTGLDVATVYAPLHGLDEEVAKPSLSPTGHPSIMEAKWKIDFLGATGVCLFIITFITGGLYRVHPLKFGKIFLNSFKRMSLSLLTICVLLAFGYVLRFSGQDTSLGLAAAKTGKGYPFVGAIIGFIGVALTGSATTCNVIFGSLQVVAANAIGLNPVQMAATNTAAGQIGHIISTSSMVIAAVASGQSAKSIGPIAKSVIGYGIAEMVLFGCWNLLVAHVFPQLIPSL